MSSDPNDGRGGGGRRPQSIPLQDLQGQYYGNDGNQYAEYGYPAQQQQAAQPNEAQMAANLPGISTYWEQPYHARFDGEVSPESPIDPSALQGALPFDLHESDIGASALPPIDTYDRGTPYVEDTPVTEYAESDRVPLTFGVGPMSGNLAANNRDERPRDSFQTVSDIDNSPSRNRNTRSLGHDLDPAFRSSRHHSYGQSLNPNEFRRSRSPSTSGALSRAGSIVRAMSQRVVNISGDSEAFDHRASRHRSRSPQGLERSSSRDTTASMLVDTSYHPQVVQPSTEKAGEPDLFPSDFPPAPISRKPLPSPLKGKSLGIFSADNFLRRRLCDILVNPYTEPLILLLIIAQAVLLAVEAAPSVFSEGNGTMRKWGSHAIDWAMLGLFIVFTLELIARIIVSGFVLNAAEYSTIDRKRGVRAAVADQYRAIFQPERHKSLKPKPHFQPEPSAIVRSFTTFTLGQQGLPQTLEEQQRLQLARRAFLRHSFNRFDFVAVVSFWITFVLSISGLEGRHHLNAFRMLSCLRILRLLALTNGTAVSDPITTMKPN